MSLRLPDWRRAITVERGYCFPELVVDPRTKFKVLFRSFPPESPLGPGAKAKLVDVETNLETPLTIPRGYYSEFVEWCFYSSVELYLRTRLDARYLGAFYVPANAETHEYERITWASTKFQDPKAELSHVWNFEVENPTATNAIAFVHTALRVVKVGSGSKPRLVKCPRCGHVWEVGKLDTRFKCPVCEHRFWTWLFGWWEG